MTYTFTSKNTSVVITLSADNYQTAQEEIDNLIIPEMNDFRLEEIEKD